MFNAKFRIGVLRFKGRGQDLIVDRQRCFNESGRACSGFGMSDIRFYRSQGASVPIGGHLAKYLTKGFKFDLVPDTGPGAVGLNQRYRRRIDARLFIGPSQRLGLPLGARSVNTLGFPITGSAQPSDDGINPVTVFFGIFEPFQHHQADAFPQHRTIGVFGEGADIAAGRQDLGFRKAHVHEGIIDGIHTTGDNHFTAAGPEFKQGHMNGTHAAGASCIDDAIGASQVKTVGDSTGHHISQQPRKRVLLPGDIIFADALDNISGLVLGHTGIFQCTPPYGMSQTGPKGNDELLCSGDAQNNTGLIAVKWFSVVAITSIFQRLFSRHQTEQLGGIGGFNDIGRNTEFSWIKLNRWQKSAPVAVDMIRLFRVGIVILLQVVVRIRWIGDAADTS